MRGRLGIVLLSFCLLAAGCTGFRLRPEPEPVASPEAQAILSGLMEKNQGLKTFKGLGKIRIWDETKLQTAKVAWAGAEDGRLRIELLQISGQPAASIASDGEWLYFVSHEKDKLYKKRTRDPDLQKVLAVPVRASDVIALIRGRIPICAYHEARVEENRYGPGQVLILRRWDRIVQRIYPEGEKRRVRKTELFDKNGDRIWQAEFDRMKTVQGFALPFRILLGNGQDLGVELRIQRYWPNAELSAEIFVLTPPQTDHGS